MELFNLFGVIALRDDASSQLDNIDNSASGLGSKLKGMIGTVAKWGAAIVAGAGVAITGAIALTKKLGDTADRLLDLNSITGMSTDEIQKWQHAAVIAGTSTEAMTMASEKLTQTLDTMSTGTGKAAEAADALGYSYEELSSMNADERMNALVSSLQGVEDKTKRAKLGTDLFGKKWAEIAPVVDLGVEGLKKAKDNANVFDEESLQSANNFRIMFDDMKDKIGFVAMKLGMKLLPIVTQFAEFVMVNMPLIESVFETVFGVVEEVVNTSVAIIKTLIEQIQATLDSSNELLPQVQETFSTVFEFIKDLIGSLVNGILVLVDTVREWVEDNKDKLLEIQEKFSEVLTIIMQIVMTFIETFKLFWSEYGEYITAFWRSIWDTIADIINIALTLIIDIFNIFKAIFTGNWSEAWEGVKKLLFDVWEAIKTIVNDALNIVNSILDAYWQMIKDLVEFIWNGILEFFTNIWEGIKSVFDNTLKSINKKINEIFSGILDWAKSTWNSITDYLVSPIRSAWEGISKWVSKIKDAVSSAISKLKKLIGLKKKSNTGGGGSSFSVGGGGSSPPSGSGYATGTENAARGWHMVGEKGPELMYFNGGEKVKTAKETEALLSGAGGITNNFNISQIVVREEADIRKIARELYFMQQAAGRGAGVI